MQEIAALVTSPTEAISLSITMGSKKGDAMAHVVQPIRALVLFAGLAMAAGSALAQQPGLYLGAGFGATKAKFGDGFASGIAGIQENKDESDKGGKLFAGVQFNRWIALEVAYHDLGKFSYDYSAA